MKIFFEDESDIKGEILNTMKNAAEYLINRDGIDKDRAEVSVSFVDEDEIQRLNKTYRGIDRVTDVLSFPQFEDFDDIPKEGDIALGDVVICSKRAEEQAEEFGHSYEREIIYLFVHSICHLLGFDHIGEDEKRAMRMREEETMKYLGITRL